MTSHHLNLGDTVYTLDTTVGPDKIDCALDSIEYRRDGDYVEALGVKLTARAGRSAIYTICLTAADAAELGTTLLMYARAAQQDGEVL